MLFLQGLWFDLFADSYKIGISKIEENRGLPKWGCCLGITSFSRGKLALKNTYFYYKILFLANLLDSAGIFFCQVDESSLNLIWL